MMLANASHIEEPLQRAIGRFDWSAVEKRLRGIEPDELAEWTENLVDAIIRDGYLIQQRPDAKKQARRDAFLVSLRAFLQANGLEHLLDNRAKQFDAQALTEVAYFELLTSVGDKLLARLSPSELVWAALRFPDKTFKAAWVRMFDAPRDSDVLFDPVTAKLPVDKDGVVAHPDQLLSVLQATLSSTLKMLAYGNDWWRNGTLTLPAPVPTTEEYGRIAGANVYLANIWRQIERNERRSRYFGGTVSREEMQLRGDDGAIRTGDTINFSPNTSMEVELQIAGERLRRMIFGFEVELHRDPGSAKRVIETYPVPPAPRGYVSLDEVHGENTLSHLFFKPVANIGKQFGGLTLLQWLRGYAVIRILAHQHLDGSESPDGIVLFAEDELIKVFVDHGLPDDKAKAFLDHACFSKESDDVCDAPFVRCEDGRLCFIVTGGAYLNLPFVVLSQLSTLGCNMDWKGEPFEESVIELFRKYGIDAASFKRKIEGKELQIDGLVHWGDVLFVIEDKNYSLPSDNPQQEFWFLHKQIDAAGQVMAKVESVESHPEIVSEALGKTVTWSKVIPVVLNGAPFSLPGPIAGVYFFDSSALHKFFEDGILELVVEQGARREPRQIPAGVTQLWTGDRPQPEDLIKQLAKPAQVMQAAHFWQMRRQAVPLSDRLNAATTLLDRMPTTIELMARSLGIGEDELKASIAETTGSSDI